MHWRRRTPWARRDAIAFAAVVLSIAATVFLVQATEIQRGIRQGLVFLLVFMFIGGFVVLLVRHIPITALQLWPPAIMGAGGATLATIADPPVRYIAIGFALLGAANLVLRLRRLRRSPLPTVEDPVPRRDQ